MGEPFATTPSHYPVPDSLYFATCCPLSHRSHAHGGCPPFRLGLGHRGVRWAAQHHSAERTHCPSFGFSRVENAMPLPLPLPQSLPLQLPHGLQVVSVVVLHVSRVVYCGMTATVTHLLSEFSFLALLIRRASAKRPARKGLIANQPVLSRAIRAGRAFRQPCHSASTSVRIRESPARSYPRFTAR